MTERTNMPELLNRFMETSNIAIKPAETRLHRLVILRFLYSFGQVSNVDTCIAQLEEAGVNIGNFNKPTTEVRLVNFAIIDMCNLNRIGLLCAEPHSMQKFSRHAVTAECVYRRNASVKKHMMPCLLHAQIFEYCNPVHT